MTLKHRNWYSCMQVEPGAATPSHTGNKGLWPAGTSPMKITLDDTSNTSSKVMKLLTDADSTVKSDPKGSDTESKADSLNDMIESARKELFKSTLPPEVDADAITLATSKSKKWVPIKKATNPSMKATIPSVTQHKATPSVDYTASSNCRGATFAGDTNFKGREAQAAKSTPGTGEGDNLC